MGLYLENLPIPGYEQVVKVTDTATGLLAIIAIHDTTLGPSLGGTRIFPYKNFDQALQDVLRLSRGMTYKSAIAQTGLGGGKSVIIADPRDKSPELLEAFGVAVEALEGRYISAEDINCSPADVAIMSRSTRYVTGMMGPGKSGNPSPFTAWGTFLGIQSAIQQLDKLDSVKGKRIAIQGIGSVGEKLADFLFWEGAELIIQDINEEKAVEVGQKYQAEVVSGDEIFQVECDVFAPCALGGILNDKTIAQLRCRAVAGAANNQLLDEQRDGDRLAKRGILYAPDFVVNAGGVINVGAEIEPGGYDANAVRKKVAHIYNQLVAIYLIAEQNGCSTAAAANSLAEYRLQYKIGQREVHPCFSSASGRV
ncbi:MAG: Glu/Leu/Phe/Val dehydrogenase [Chlamydiota bacterium]